VPPALNRPEGELFVHSPFQALGGARWSPFHNRPAPEMPDHGRKINADQYRADGQSRHAGRPTIRGIIIVQVISRPPFLEARIAMKTNSGIAIRVGDCIVSHILEGRADRTLDRHSAYKEDDRNPLKRAKASGVARHHKRAAARQRIAWSEFRRLMSGSSGLGRFRCTGRRVDQKWGSLGVPSGAAHRPKGVANPCSSSSKKTAPATGIRDLVGQQRGLPDGIRTAPYRRWLLTRCHSPANSRQHRQDQRTAAM